MAFVTPSAPLAASRSSFAGAACEPAAGAAAPSPRSAPAPRMAYSPSGMSKWARMPVKDYLKRPAPEPTPTPSPPQQGSAVWLQSLEAMKLQNAPLRAPMFYPYTIGKVYAPPVSAPAVAALPPPSAGRAADEYMAGCITRQYKAMAVDGGVYDVQCAEGAARGQAEERRVSAGYAAFRRGLRTPAERFGDFYETRKRAVIAAHGCSYEEALVTKFPKSAAKFVLGQAEANRSCVRYAAPASAAEEFMGGSVDRQMKARACPGGVYAPSCTEGVTKGQAETARELALSKEFRMNTASPTSKERAKFESRKYALAGFGHGCSYEEALFCEYPAVAASMRPPTTGF